MKWRKAAQPPRFQAWKQKKDPMGGYDLVQGEVNDQGEMDGRCVYISPGRYACFGHFKRDKGHGQMTMIYSKGNKYEHTCYEGIKHGEDILTYSDGNIEIRTYDRGTWTETVTHDKDKYVQRNIDNEAQFD